jgi:nucleoid-associated protein EbfC
MMRNMAGMMKKVQEMQGRMESMQADLAAMEFTTMVGGGGKLVRLKLDPAVLAPDDVDMLEDMICLATNNALDEAAGEKARLLKDITGGLPLPPGMNLPF